MGHIDTSGGLSFSEPKLLLSQQVEGNFGHHPSQYNGNENGSCSLVSHPPARKVTPLVWDWSAKSAQPRGLLLSSESAPEEQSFISESCCNALILCTFPQMAAITFSFFFNYYYFCISACCLMWAASFCLFWEGLGVCTRAPFRLSIRHSCGQAAIFFIGVWISRLWVGLVLHDSIINIRAFANAKSLCLALWDLNKYKYCGAFSRNWLDTDLLYCHSVFLIVILQWR